MGNVECTETVCFVITSCTGPDHDPFHLAALQDDHHPHAVEDEGRHHAQGAAPTAIVGDPTATAADHTATVADPTVMVVAPTAIAPTAL